MTAANLAEVGRPDPGRGVIDGRDTDAVTGRLLSVAELQHALQLARTGTAPAAVVAGPGPMPVLRAATAKQLPTGDSAAASFIVALGAHGGAGTSTVALAIAEAAAVTNPGGVQLTETVTPALSGFAAAATNELGVDETGEWRRGARGAVTISRRATELNRERSWPQPVTGWATVHVVDLGLTAGEEYLSCSEPGALAGAATVVVCRATVPGVRHAERILSRLAGMPVLVAAVGDAKWPGAVKSSTGPLLTALRAAGRVVPVPTDRHLEVAGLSSGPLPKNVAAAGRSLLALLDIAVPGAVITPAGTPVPHS